MKPADRFVFWLFVTMGAAVAFEMAVDLGQMYANFLFYAAGR